MIASGAGSAEVVRMLIESGADLNAAESRRGQTALHWAAAEAHPDVVQLLVEKGANINAASKSGFTALVFASIKNDAASVKALLAAGADPNYALPDGTKVLTAAVAHRSTAASIALLDGGADPNQTDRTGNTLLHTAAQAGDVDLIRKLISKKVPVDPRTPDAPMGGGRGGGGFRFIAGSQTPLFLAARAGHVDAMRVLIEAGADTKARAQDGSTFLMAAVGSAKASAVRFAYEHDPDVRIVTKTGATLMHASVTGTANGATLEAQERVCEVIRFLAEKGAPLDEKNAAGRTPIDLADILPIDKAVDLLTELILKSGAKPKSPSKR
jgi:ankyrin repeat protein